MSNDQSSPPKSDYSDFTEALKSCANNGQTIQLERLVGRGRTYIFSGKIIDVITNEGKCLVQRNEQRQEYYQISYLFRLIDVNGKTTENRAALQKHAEAINRKQQRADISMRTLTDPKFIPPARLSTSTPEGSISGTIDNKSCSFFVFRGRSYKPSAAVVYAKNDSEASRCMKLLDIGHSIWDTFAVFLQAHFFWPAWINLREQAKNKATELRGNQPILPSSADNDTKYRREKFYESHGLNWQEWGPTADLYSLEGDDLDFMSLFKFAEKIPTPILNIYLIVSSKTMQFFNEIDRLDNETLEKFIEHDLVMTQPAPTAEIAIDAMAISDLRELVNIAGTGFKSKSSAPIREHLKNLLTPELRIEVVRRAKYKKYQLLPPPGWSWEQFQFMRTDYRYMLEALHEWMLSGQAHPRAEERFRAFI